MTSNTPENLFSIITGIDSFGDGTSLIYKGDEMVSRLESDESAIGYTMALTDLGFSHQDIDIDADDWREGEEWGSDAPFDSLTELLESARGAGFEVRITPGSE